jgi:hypothetical protein
MPFQTPLPVWGLAFLTRVRGWDWRVGGSIPPPCYLVERRRGLELCEIEHQLTALLQLRDEDRHDVLGI